MRTLLLGLDELGFGNLNEIDALNPAYAPAENVGKPAEKKILPDDFVYDKGYVCPVCDRKFKEKTVKASKLRFQDLDIDLMPRYTPIYPFHYNVVICTNCGYAALSESFPKITESQEVLIKNQITPRYRNKDYTFPFTEDMAIERYKYALLNAIVKKSRINERAYICLVISWLYKLKEDEENRRLYAKNAYDTFVSAYGQESLPFFGMNEPVTSYLIGELARYTGDRENAVRWVSRVLGSRIATEKIKSMAIDLKHRIADDIKRES